jgi:hypothetical protein
LVLALPLAVCLQVILREIVIHDILDRWKTKTNPPILQQMGDAIES